MWWQLRGRRGQRRGDDDVAAECEAFLSGTYAYRLLERGCPVPPWAWINVLAHAPRARIEGLAAGRDDLLSPDAAGPWTAALRALGAELLDTASAARTELSELQRLALVPLEAEALRTPALAPRRPGQLRRRVSQALAVHRSQGRSRSS